MTFFNMQFLNAIIFSPQEALNIALQDVAKLLKGKHVMMNVKLENTNIIGVMLEIIGIIVRVHPVQ